MPNGLVPTLPGPFGISTRRTGGARYVPVFSRAQMSWTRVSSSRSNSAVVSPSTPLAPRRFICRQVSMRNAGREQMRQRGEAQRAVCRRLGRNLFQLCGHPLPTSERRGCVPGPAPRPAPPLPLVRGFPAPRVLPADPTSTTASAFLWLVHSVGLLDRLPVKTVVDLPGSVALPCPSVPCSQTPPESPAPSPFAGAYWCLPSFRPCRPPVDQITRLNRFTC